MGPLASYENEIRSSNSLSNVKPSAIFKLRNLDSASMSSSSFGSMTFVTPASTSLAVSIGFRCEPLSSIAAQLPPSSSAYDTSQPQPPPSMSTALTVRNSQPDAAVLATQLLKHLYNTIASFAQPLPDGSGSWIDLRAFDVWYQKITTKIKNGGSFSVED